jgi:hypothetical protein
LERLPVFGDHDETPTIGENVIVSVAKLRTVIRTLEEEVGLSRFQDAA